MNMNANKNKIFLIICRVYISEYTNIYSNVTLMLRDLLKKVFFVNIDLTLRKGNYTEIYTQLLVK